MARRLLQGVKATRQTMEGSVCCTRQEDEGVVQCIWKRTDRSHRILRSSDIDEAKCVQPNNQAEEM